jgi:hypothetical protein
MIAPLADEYMRRMNPDNWRCSLCGRPGDLTVRVPKTGLVHFEPGEGDEIVPLIIKLHQGNCRAAFDEQFPTPSVGKGEQA